MHSSENYALLNDTLRDARYEAFRARTFAAGLKVVRSKRPPLASPARLALAAAVALLLGLANALVRHLNLEPTRAESHDSATVFVATRPLAPGEVVRSSRDPSLFASTEQNSATFETVATIHLLAQQLNDRELLAIFANRPTALVRRGDRREFLLLDN
jgi:hypothetical protein